jgi:two-component system chemotaxis sensor kinase CheA
MMEEIRRRFLPRFAELARERITKGSEIANSSLRGQEALQLARELHSLAGEAGLLGFTSVIKLARTAEEAATELHAQRSDTKASALTNALKELANAIDGIERNES